MTVWLTDKAPAAGEEQRHHEATVENLRQFCPEAVAQIEQDASGQGIEPARAEATAAERERVQAILNLDEAKGREAVAQKLATTAGMTADSAREILAATPQQQETSLEFFAGMEDPNVSPDGPSDGEGSDPAAFAAGIAQQVRDSGFIR